MFEEAYRFLNFRKPLILWL